MLKSTNQGEGTVCILPGHPCTCDFLLFGVHSDFFGSRNTCSTVCFGDMWFGEV